MDRSANTDHPIHELHRRRWSPRAFAPQSVAPAILARLFEAARWSASSFNEQPWAFLVATKEQPEEFQRMLGCLMEVNRTWARAAPVLMLTAAHATFTRNGQPNRVAVYDLGQAAAQLALQATAEDLVVHQMAGILLDEARKTYAIPAGWDPVTAIAVGYLGDPATLSEELRRRETAVRERKKLKEFVFAGSWGQPAPL